ncbi:Fe-S-containing hydro-lyase [Clostridiaceae bacterium HSG29]|nr:Fe-S-containing hydro-lyase [Clostridiaceae bacterium HSG29]
MIKKIQTPLTKEITLSLNAGDSILLSGTIYTGRDQAHKRLVKLIQEGKKLPFELENQVIYYVGPSPTKPGNVIGSAGPTTSYRMDDLTEPLLDLGLKGMIGKGQRNQVVINSIKKNNAIYFAAIGGAGALIANSIKECEIIAFDELGPEAIRKLVVKDMPLTVVIDCKGNNLYDIERKKYQRI